MRLIIIIFLIFLSCSTKSSKTSKDDLVCDKVIKSSFLFDKGKTLSQNINDNKEHLIELLDKCYSATASPFNVIINDSLNIDYEHLHKNVDVGKMVEFQWTNYKKKLKCFLTKTDSCIMLIPTDIFYDDQTKEKARSGVIFILENGTIFYAGSPWAADIFSFFKNPKFFSIKSMNNKLMLMNSIYDRKVMQSIHIKGMETKEILSYGFKYNIDNNNNLDGVRLTSAFSSDIKEESINSLIKSFKTVEIEEDLLKADKIEFDTSPSYDDPLKIIQSGGIDIPKV